MTYEMFKEIVIQNIKKYLPQDWSDAKIERNQFQKVNYMKDSIVFRKHPEKGMIISPEVDVSYWYQNYLKGCSLSEVLTELAETVVHAEKKIEPVYEDLDFNKVKDNLFCQLINTAQNKEFLKDLPHREFHDLSIIYVWLIRESKTEGLVTSRVSNTLAEMIGYNEEELYQLAMENTKRILPPVTKTMREVIDEIMGKSAVGEMQDLVPETEHPMYVISNRVRHYGASAMLFEEELQKLAEQLGEDFYIIPSSIHECIVLPKSYMDLEDVAEMVYEINMAQVELKDRLSNEVYQYDSDARKVILATDVQNKSLDDCHKEQQPFPARESLVR